MLTWQVIGINLLIFAVVAGAAWFLSNIYPGRVAIGATRRADVADTEVRQARRQFAQSAYILALSLLADGLDELAIHLVRDAGELHRLLAVEIVYLHAWLLLWTTATTLAFVELVARTRYVRRDQPFPVSRLLATILRSVALAAVALWIARYVLGWPSTHVLVSGTALAVVGGYAAKETVSDLIAGVSLHLTQAALPGHWIDVPDADVAGEVLSTSWRETRIRTTSGHVHILPNAKLAGAVFHNVSWPDPNRRHALAFHVGFEADPADVTAALVAAAVDERILHEPKPPQAFVRAFTELGIRYELRFWTTTWHDRSTLEGKVQAAAWRELKARGVPMPEVSAAASR